MVNLKQLKVLLWKDYLLRIRHKGTLSLLFLWPIVVFLTLFIIRVSVNVTKVPTCQFKARALPSAGLLPFMQSYICSVNDDCDPVRKFERIPSYKTATLSPLLRKLQPVITNSTVIESVQVLPSAVKLLNAFSHALDNPDLKEVLINGISISGIFKNPEEVKQLVVAEYPEFKDLLDLAFNGSIKTDYISELLGPLNITELVCDPVKVQRYIRLPTPDAYNAVSSALCALDEAALSKLTKIFAANADVGKIIRLVFDSNFSGIIRKVGISLSEVSKIIQELPKLVELIPKFREVFADVQNVITNPTKHKISHAKSGNWLSDASSLLCGHSIIAEHDKVADMISKLKDKTDAKGELKQLPENCKALFRNITSIPNGKLIWSYMKPLIRGKILYTPDTAFTRNLFSNANSTFSQLNNFHILVSSVYEGLISLNQFAKSSSNVNSVMEVPAVAKIFGNSTGGISISDAVSFIKGDGETLSRILQTIVDVLDCVSVDRYKPASSELELENEAVKYMADNEFLAGVVFLNIKNDTEIPDKISYKIRMDIDNVPTTSRTRSQFWFPGPESEFEYQRYYRGFIQLQDSIDKAIMKYFLGQNIEDTDNKSNNETSSETSIETNENTTGVNELGGTYMQELPYPCWKRDPFQNGLYISQGLQVCFFFAFIMSVSSSVRYAVWERESGNVELMKTMGLRVWSNTLSWFITTSIEITVVIMTIVVILKICNILPNANWFLLFVYFMCYGFATVMFCYMVQAFCSIASLAALGSIMFNFLTFMPYIIVIAMDAVLSYRVQIILQLSMSTSFSYGCLLITRLEAQGVGVTWDSIWTPITPGGANMITTAGMLIFDAILYCTIALCLTSMKPVAVKSNEDSSDLDKTGVKLSKVSKIYNKGKSDEKVALSDITMDLPEGRITALLGENGAGKTTLIKILTGSIQKTSGELSVGHGGQHIGVCPQSNVLFDVLTPLEHLQLYAALKADGAKYNKDIIKNMLSAMDLGLFENYFARNLSDGLKRRLCVAIAFIGYPKLIILDEPSSGVDPVARSGLLNLVGKLTKQRASDTKSTVLLTTHHMDEADFISDHLMIMNKGKILAAGNSRDLKRKYCYYVLTLRFSAKLEMTEEDLKQKSSSVMSLLASVVENAELLEVQRQQFKYKLPVCNALGENTNFHLALKLVEESQTSLGIDKFYLEGGDLSDVVLALCYSEHEENSKSDRTSIKLSTDTLFEVNGSTKQLDDDLSHLLNPNTRADGFSMTLRRFKALIVKRSLGTIRNYRLLLSVLILPALVQAIAMGFSLIKPPPEIEYPLKLSSDLYPGYQFISLNSNNEQLGKAIEDKLLQQSKMHKAFLKYQNITSECECTKGKRVCYPPIKIPNLDSNNFENIVTIPSAEEAVRWIVDTNELFIEKRYGGWAVEFYQSKISPVVWYNNKGYHSMPGFLNTLNNVLLKQFIGGDGKTNISRIDTYSHPLRLSKEQLSQSTLLHHVADAGISLVILVGFSLVTASAVSYLVQERTSHEKRLQMLSGVNPVLYWCTALIWDLLICAIVLLLAVIIFVLFDIPVFTARENLSGISVLLFLYCFASLPLMYLLEKLFQVNSLANMILFCCNVFAGMITITTILLMDVLGKTQTVADARDFLHSLFLVIPQFAMADGLIEISKNYVQATLLERFSLDTYISPLSWELMGLHYMMLIIVGIILFILNILLEYHIRCSMKTAPRSIYEEDDIDVQKEKVRVCERAGPLREAVAIKDIYKEYGYPCSAKVEAVRGVTFGVPSGQCFGLLGVNGAGKSTMFKMLIGELMPSRGILETQEKHNNAGISYCPQNDALDPVMTPEEHIKFYARLRGIQDEELITRNTLKRFGLTQYRNVQVCSLSGGNKRKLNAAISIMGNSKIIIMDEPTSGMDPSSRSSLLHSLRNLSKTGRSVLVTSHSMSDCEAICDRVAIMVSGKLLALGNPHDLKQRFFSGYVISIHVSDTNNISDVSNAISSSIPYARCLGKNYHTIQYLVPNVKNISDLFLAMANISKAYEIDYTIALPSLDNVFVSLCKTDTKQEQPIIEKSLNGTVPLSNISLSTDSETEDHNITRL